MSHITIDLQEGFHADAVMIRLNGEVVFNEQNISTRMQTGLARRIELDTAEPSSVISVDLPGRRLMIAQQIDTSNDLFVGVSIAPVKDFYIRTQPTEFHYA